MKFKNKTIQKRPNGNTWWTRIRINGKQHTISGKTQQECYNKLKEFYKQNSNTIEKPKEYTFENWWKKWIELYKKDNKQTTLNEYTYYYKKINHLSKLKINEIKTITMIDTINNIKGTRQKQRCYIILNDLFDKAKKLNIIKDNPLTNIEKPKHQKIKERKALTLTQQQDFIKQCKLYDNVLYADFFLTILFQGLRRGECMAIQRKDIDFKNKTLSINESATKENTITTTKNKSSNRIMPLFDETYKRLLKYENINENEYIFNLNVKTQTRHKTKILNNAGLPHFTTHELRHTFITRCEEQNIPEHIIQKWVGHEIGSLVTKKVYTHIDNEVSIINSNKINDLFNSTN